MKRFHYSLEALLKQSDWEIQSLKMEVMTLNQVLNARTSELQQMQTVVSEAEQQIVEMCQKNAVISIDRKMLIEKYVREQRSHMAEKQLEIDQTQKLIDDALVQLGKKKQSQRALEKHRERKKKEFDTEAIRLEALEADELWLSKTAASQ